ncbi:MAG: hypothetical protein P8J33_08610 [Pirellulaceae bacterium]|nr:hypothetical protein [Pirellulaceae bacterium]
MNGKPFSGWGAGGLASGGLADAALLPRRMNDPTAYNSATPNGSLAEYIRTGVNESYDAYGFQNAFLAYDPDGDPINFRASFNDPELFDFVSGEEKKYANFRPVTNLYTDAQDPARPVDRASGWANPNDLKDVDNDGDGQLDSIWMDFGYPVQTEIDGRRYKPLVAVMVQDMDGRLNVNAHGNGYVFDSAMGLRTPTPLNPGGRYLLGGIDPSAQELPRGLSVGPAEIDLRYAFNDDLAVGRVLSTKYGEDGLPGVGKLNPNGDIVFRDPWNYYQTIGYPDSQASIYDSDENFPNQYTGGQFSSPLDIHGRYVTGIPNPTTNPSDMYLPPTGYPMRTTFSSFNDPSEEIASSAYEFTLSDSPRFPVNTASGDIVNSDDQPYTPQELEKVLRRFDRDYGGLNSRLYNLLPAANIDALRNQITTESWEVPGIPSFEASDGSPISIQERLHGLLLDSMDAQQANLVLEDLLSPEIRMGLPFDINRPFGDGKDNNGNGVYDEHAEDLDPNVNEALLGESVNIPSLTDAGVVQMVPQLLNNDHLARWQYAKELYVLALLATGDTGSLGGANSATARRRTSVAQWVINVVDYRDADSINTPFEFDLHPFDGWSVDGYLGVGPGPDGILGNGDDIDDSDPANTQLALVWGVERPEILISETFASHDRRTQDLDLPGDDEKFEGGDDTDFDSKLVPRATAFFELYHPWSQDNENQLVPAELAVGQGGISNAEGIDLQKKNTAGDPVWRMVVTRDYVNANPQDQDIDEAKITRRIYFAEPTPVDFNTQDSVGTAAAFSGEKVYFPSLSGQLLMPRGGYAVVGSGGIGTYSDGNGAKATFFGRRTDVTPDGSNLDVDSLNQTRRIVLDSAGSVSVFDPSDGLLPPRPAAVIEIDQCNPAAPAPLSLGISDPAGGYQGAKDEILDGFEFQTGLTTPVDNDPAIQTDARVLINGTVGMFAGVLLQRLANPLKQYDPVFNPYLTIDRKSVDLVAFNGVEDDSEAPGITDETTLFSTNERGRSSDPMYRGDFSLYKQRRMLWLQDDPTSDIPGIVTNPDYSGVFDDLGGEAGDLHVFSFKLWESLGQLNASYTDVEPRPATELSTGENAPLGFSGLPWLNRPFANRMEMLDVTFRDSFLFLERYSVPDLPIGTYGHLLQLKSVFDDASETPTGMAALLDFVRVPSLFTGTRKFLENGTPPFNVLSNYREPGKLNLNTMRLPQADEAGWQGLLGPMYGVDSGDAEGNFVSGAGTTYSAGLASFTDIADSLEGAGGPALIGNPFRNSVDFNKLPGSSGAAVDPFEVTLFRTQNGTDAVFRTQGNLPYADPARDSAAANGILRKLGTTTTTRSSVFAIWITVGKFEVDANGVLLGTGNEINGGLVELGADEGKNKRSRGFYLIDRSIPVGFEPGVNHNVEKIILAETIMD